MEKKILWLDVDGVLLDWTRPFLRFIKSKKSYEDLREYSLANELFDGDKKESRDWIDQFNESPEYESLEPLVSREALYKLIHSGYSLNCITQTTSPVSEKMRYHNLAMHFGFETFDNIVFTRHGDNKAEILRNMNPYDTIRVVEDNPQFFRDAKKVGGFKPMAILHPYNRLELKNMLDFPLYTDMAEVVRHLCS